jgi:hypothetical protein
MTNTDEELLVSQFSLASLSDTNAPLKMPFSNILSLCEKPSFESI